MNETWKQIPNYEDYMVSNKGRVKSLKYNKTRILKQNKNADGYLSVNLSKSSKTRTFTTHILMAYSFLNHKPSGNKFVVDHINNIKTDNRLDNLQIITQRENTSKDRCGYSSEYIGVSWNKLYKKWHSYILINKKRITLGYFDCELKAAKVYQEKLKELNLN